MLQRFIGSVRKRGLPRTLRMASGLVLDASRRPRHLAEHLSVPLEMLRHPRHARAWLRDRIAPENPVRQAVPWIAWGCIDFLSGYLEPGHRVFEWGGGGSTLFFLSRGCEVTTVESNRHWASEIVARIPPNRRNRLHLRFIEADSNRHQDAERYVSAVRDGAPWDILLIDGWNRSRCLEMARHAVVPGGLIILDNANQEQFRRVPHQMDGWQRMVFRGLGPARTWVTQTDIYRSP